MIKSCQVCGKKFNATRNAKNCNGCRQPSANNDIGFLYIMRDNINNITKVGITEDPKTRIQRLKSSYPFPTLELFCLFRLKNFKGVEKITLEKFKEYKSNGEYFVANPYNIFNYITGKYLKNIITMELHELQNCTITN